MKRKELNAFNATIIFLFFVVLAFLSPELLANTPPEFNAVPAQTVNEGDILNLVISATDADQDPISIVAISRPSVSNFTDNGDGTATLYWQPDFTGPNSSEGSPFTFSFMASDGTASSQIQVIITVLNNNRKPVINPVGTIEYVAGDLVAFEITGSDADSDPLEWNLLSAPQGVIFNSNTIAEISWQTAYADSGSYSVSVELADSYGAADTVNVAVDILPKSIYELSITPVSAFPAEKATMSVNLTNLEEISGFNLLINYDKTALFLSNITRLGTRANAFEYFNYQLENNNIKGDVLITGIADIDNGVTTDNIPAGEGSIIDLTFYVTNDLTFSGYSVPVNFVFRNLIDNLDNTLTNGLGETVDQEAINYTNGYIGIKNVDITGLGDINQNGVAYEIADAIYFINYFINPGKFPLSPEQRANTDVNKDGLTATIADLVFLINYLSNRNGSGGKLRQPDMPVEINSLATADNFSLSINSDIEIGGLAITLEGKNPINSEMVAISDINAMGMKVLSSIDNNSIRILVYSDEGNSLPIGVNDLLAIREINQLAIKNIELSSADGVLLKTVVGGSSHSLPAGYQLEQNHPNPFNPITVINFSLPEMAKINLTVYNLLGQEVRTLIETTLASGAHSVIWDGRNNQGLSVSSGIYFYRLRADGFEAKRKMILMK